MQALAKSELVCRFKVGRDRAGRWTVVDRKGLVGGFFVSQQAALHFALFESDYAPGAVWCAPTDGIEAIVASSRSAAVSHAV